MSAVPNRIVREWDDATKKQLASSVFAAAKEFAKQSGTPERIATMQLVDVEVRKIMTNGTTPNVTLAIVRTADNKITLIDRCANDSS